MYFSVEQLKKDIEAFGVQFVVLAKNTPTEAELNKFEAAYWWNWQDVPSHIRSYFGPCDGALFFGSKSLTLMFGYSPMTKAGLKAFLFGSSKCGICTEFALIGSGSCRKCGFAMCAVCRVKLRLQQCKANDNDNRCKVLCPQCRSAASFCIAGDSMFVAHDTDKFVKIEQVKLSELGSNEQDVGKFMQDLNGKNVELKDKFDMTNCASCKEAFVQNRFICGGCKKVSYCDPKCQKEHWNQHKKECKELFTHKDVDMS